MKFAILMSILATASSVTFKTADQCKCAQVKNYWMVRTLALALGQITRAQPSVSKFASYCTTITDGLVFANSHGCAYIEAKCSLFIGCASYARIKNSDCQVVSTRCNYNGYHCVEGDTCATQSDQAGCESVL